MLKHQSEALLASVSDTTRRNVHKQYDWDTDPSTGTVADVIIDDAEACALLDPAEPLLIS